MSRYYSRQGRELSLEEWMLSFDNLTEEARRIALTHVSDECEVSTVWLGLDHQYSPGGPPLIFETMIFGGPCDSECWRYSTEAQAVAGHAEAVRVARAALAKVDE